MNPRPSADVELVARARNGEIDAFATLIERYQAPATGLAAMVTLDPSEAEDVAQEAFIKAYYALDRFRADASFRAWLMRIVVNEARNSRSAAQRRTTLHSRAGEDLPLGRLAPSAEESAVTNEQRGALLTALEGLREDDRVVLVYRYVFDLNEAEMAQALGCSPGTVKSRLSRSLSRLRKDVTRVAPLLVVTPDFNTLLAKTLAGAAPPAGTPTHSLAAAVLRRLAAAAQPSNPSSPGGGSGRPSQQQVVVGGIGAAIVLALVATGLFASASGRRQTPEPTIVATSAAPQTAATIAASPEAVASAIPNATTVVIAFGGDLTDSQRQELNQVFGATSQVSTETVSHEELVSGLQAAGLAVDSSERAISSARVECLEVGDGLRVRTENITQLPAAAYANALATAGIADASVVVAAPPSTPMTGETALVGVLKAYPHCHPGQQVSPERGRLAYDQLRVTAALGEASGAWDRAAAVMLRSVQSTITARAPDEAMLGTFVDQAATAEGVALGRVLRTDIVSVLGRVSHIDHGPYGGGYAIQQMGATDAKLSPLAPTRP